MSLLIDSIAAQQTSERASVRGARSYFPQNIKPKQEN
jgi:hypothetical protein